MTYDKEKYSAWFRAQYYGDAAWRAEHLNKAEDWRKSNTVKSRDYRREYMRRYRAAKKLQKEQANAKTGE